VTEPPPAERPDHFVQSLERGLAVIRAFSAEQPQMTLSDAARATGLTRAAARRFLLTLVDLHYVHTDGRVFWLSPRVLELGHGYLSSLSLPEVAEPHMERLVAQVRESCSISVLDEGDVIYVARVPVSRIMTVSINVGTRLPAGRTSMGRVLLAATDDSDPKLAEVRRDGYAIVDQELEEGLRSIAVPLRDGSGTVVAAMNLSTHAARRSVASLRDDLLPALRETAARIEADLGAAASPAHVRRRSGT
jgi:IclR family transcriptional regulator, pca regulon regulatory protein